MNTWLTSKMLKYIIQYNSSIQEIKDGITGKMKIHPLLWMAFLIVFLILIVGRIMWVIRFVFPAMIPIVIIFLAGYWIYTKLKSHKVKNDNADGENPESKI